MKPPEGRPVFAVLATLLLMAGGCGGEEEPPVPESEVVKPVPADSARNVELAGFVERDFPYITTTVDARDLAPFMPRRNVSTRGLALRLGDSTYAAFDPDLLRMAVGWTGDFVSMGTMAQVSYDQPRNKSNKIPQVLGEPLFGTGLYPGWAGPDPQFEDPRAPGPNPKDPGRGPLADQRGEWKGLYTRGEHAVLAYAARGTDIREQPGSLSFGAGRPAVTRTIRTREPAEKALTLVLAEVEDSASATVERGTAKGNAAWITHGDPIAANGAAADSAAAGKRATMVAAKNLPSQAELEVVQDRYLTLRLPAGTPASTFKTAIWTGPADARTRLQEALDAAPVRIASGPSAAGNASSVGGNASSEDNASAGWFSGGGVADDQDASGSSADTASGKAYWPEPVYTRGVVAPDTSAYVFDRLTLPMPNRWNRNVRVADIDFFAGGRAAVVTFSGDVWLISGIDEDLKHLRWKRFASGLYEPLSIEVQPGGEIYVYGREGIVRPRDLDGDQEADFYESFSNEIIQSTETREWPLDMTPRKGGGFYVSMGAALNFGPETGVSKPVNESFRYGSPHAGTVVSVGPKGDTVRVFADGFREPYLGHDEKTGLLTASDQQGHFVPSTPIYQVQEDRYYGVPATYGRSGSPPAPQKPITWIPHTADPAGSSQQRVRSDELGPLDGALVHMSYARPGLFRILPDTSGRTWQGGAISFPHTFHAPTVKGRVRGEDGHFYVGGFRIWGSQADVTSRLLRMRYTGEPSGLPTGLKMGREGVIVRFPQELDPATVRDRGNYQVERWNYRRTKEYGSGHYLPESGKPGEERMPVAAARLSSGGKAVLLVLPDMKPVQQMQLSYQLRSEEGQALRDTLHLTVNQTPPLDLQEAGFGDVDWRAAVQRARQGGPQQDGPGKTVAATARRGRHLYQETGCVGCHNLEGPINQKEGQVGPSFAGLYGAERPLKNGETVTADEEYLRKSILNPNAQIVEGYETGMPAFEGVLQKSDIESLVLFIKSLEDSTAAAQETASSNAASQEEAAATSR